MDSEIPEIEPEDIEILVTKGWAAALVDEEGNIIREAYKLPRSGSRVPDHALEAMRDRRKSKIILKWPG